MSCRTSMAEKQKVDYRNQAHAEFALQITCRREDA